MTGRKEFSDEKKGILEQMLQSFKIIGQNVEPIVDRFDAYSAGRTRGYDDESLPQDI